MKKLLTTNITATAAMPIRKATLDHLQASWTELINATTASLIGKPYGNIGQFAIIGCENSTPGGATYTIEAGWIMYNGTLYAVDAVVVNTVGPQVPVASIVTTYDATDPTQFTDSNSHNIHETKKITFTAGSSGSGLFNYSALEFVEVTPDYVGSSTGVAFGTGFDDNSTGYRVYYAKNRDAMVTVEGVCYADGTPSMGDAIFTLPASLWPSVDKFVPAVFNVAGTFAMGHIQIRTNGEVKGLSDGAIFTTPLQFENDTVIYIHANYYR